MNTRLNPEASALYVGFRACNQNQVGEFSKVNLNIKKEKENISCQYLASLFSSFLFLFLNLLKYQFMID